MDRLLGFPESPRLIPEDKVAEIRERVDIVSLVDEYVPLKKSGSSFKGLCPFHGEKTPSFYVHPKRRFFHCFGCQASGDVFSFLMRLEGLSFPDVARQLADRAGVEIPTEDPRAEAEYQQRKQLKERLAEVMDAAAGYYLKELKEHRLGDMARAEYLGRGILDDTSTSFRLGYAPEGWDGLLGYLKQNGFSLADAETLGLIVPRKSGSGHYDRFRHRLMFPVADLHGRIVAFSGRLLAPPPGAPEPADGEKGAKYINSPETPLYTKGEILFGLHEGRVMVRQEGWVLLCEGNFDLIALHQAGFQNSVAPMGTALTDAQAKLLKRFAERVVLLFDGDRAGREAVQKAYPILQRAGLAASVVTLPPGADPDSFLREEGAEALRTRIQAAPGIVESLIDQAAAESAGDAHGRAEAIEALGPILLLVENPVEVRFYVERVARKFGIADIDAVRRQLRRGVRSNRPARNREELETKEETPDVAPSRAAILPGLECEIITAILDNPSLIDLPDAENVEELLTSPDLRAIFQATSRMVKQGGAIDGPTLLNGLSDNPAVGWLREQLATESYDMGAATEILRDGIPRLAHQNIVGELPRLQQRILEARRIGDENRANELTRQYTTLTREAAKLKQGSTKR